jgi:26S proteasome regulatory subunit N4
MSADGLPRHQQHNGDAELMPAPVFSNSSRQSVASRDSPSTPPSFDEERRKAADYRSTMPKLDRTMTDVYQDELYNPSFEITSAPPARSGQAATTLSQNTVFSQRLQAANNQHLSSMSKAPLTIPSRELSPFRQGSPLAPTGNGYGSQKSPNMRIGTAAQLREQQKAENDAMQLQQQLGGTSPAQSPPNTISPKDVDLVYHENEEDANLPLFPPSQQSPQYRSNLQQVTLKQERLDTEDNTQLRRFDSATRSGNSSAYADSKQNGSNNYNFAPPAIPESVRQVPQQYPFVPQARRQPSNMSSVNDDFPATLTSMESSSSEYTGDISDIKKPSGSSADTGTYTCTYHNCTLRFDTPSKLQRHKRDGHRQSASLVSQGEDSGSGMTSAARNSQAGPHKCERINPSTGKPCNTIFSRPYDLTRHEDTIHNERKQKVRCHLCTEEKTFSRNDALTRHFRVCHPEVDFPGKHRRRNAARD